MGKIKVIFLDVDGVLNSDRTARRTQSGYTFVDNRQMKNLKHIINMTGAKVVLSSDWRYDRDDPRYNGDYHGVLQISAAISSANDSWREKPHQGQGRRETGGRRSF